MDTHFYLLQKYKGFFWGFYSRSVVDNEYDIIFLASASPQLYQDALNFYQGWKKQDRLKSVIKLIKFKCLSPVYVSS